MGLLNFKQTTNLTTEAGNTDPLVVQNLNMAMEPSGELVQYYTVDSHTNDKSVLTEYGQYDDLQWSLPSRRLTGKQVERIGIKSFPGIGSMAYCKLQDQLKTIFFIPVNVQREYDEAPVLAMTMDADRIRVEITGKDYDYYRLVLRDGYFAVEHISYSREFDIPMPEVKGIYACTVIGYSDEGNTVSAESNEVELTVASGSGSWAPVSLYPDMATIEQMIKDAVGSGGGGSGGPTIWLNSYNPALHTISISTDTLLNDSLDASNMIVSDAVDAVSGNSALTVNYKLVEGLQEGTDINIKLLSSCYRNGNGITNSVTVNARTPQISDFYGILDTMTNTGWTTDDGTFTLTISGMGTVYNGSSLSSIIVSGNGFFGFNSQNENFHYNRRDQRMLNFYWEMLNVYNIPVLKLHWYGTKVYSSGSTAYIAFELYMLDNGDCVVHFLQDATPSSSNGTFQIFGISYTRPTEENPTVSLYRRNAAGTLWISVVGDYDFNMHQDFLT